MCTGHLEDSLSGVTSRTAAGSKDSSAGGQDQGLARLDRQPGEIRIAQNMFDDPEGISICIKSYALFISYYISLII